ncbi:MAG: hypothetical protein AB7T63_16735 [Planctomycetota bacterium]
MPVRRDVVRALVPPLALCAGLVLLGEILLYRVPWTADPLDLVGENGRIELTQTAVGVAFGATMVLIARAHARVRPLAILLAGFAVALLVREQNNYFKDHVGAGVWQAVVAAVALATCAIAWRSRRALPHALLDLLRRPAGGLLVAAVAVFAYAQLFDETRLWQHLLQETDVPFAARRVTEEGLELAAYVLAFAAGLAWRAGLVRASGDREA